MIDQKEKEILKLKDKSELDVKKNDQLNNEIANFSDIYDTKEKL